MTTSQQESLYFMYVSASNGYFYADDLSTDDSLPPRIRADMRIIRDKFKWIKTSIELKSSSALKSVDTLRYDELYRLMSMLDTKHENAIEKLINDYISDIKNK